MSVTQYAMRQSHLSGDGLLLLRCFFFFRFFSGGGERLSLEMGDSPPPTSAADPDLARFDDFFEDFFDFEYFSTSLSEESDEVCLKCIVKIEKHKIRINFMGTAAHNKNTLNTVLVF